MKPDEYTEDKPKKKFEWGYLYKVYLVILIAVFLLALANQANAGVFLEINGNMDYYDSQLPLGDIMQNSDTWDAVSNYMNDVHGVPFPTYSEATQMDDLLENVLMYYVGQYCNLSGTAAQQVYDTCMDITDAANTVWDLISLDLESGDFIATPNPSSGDLSDVIHGVVDPLIYTPSGGYWYSLPLRVKVSGTSEYYNFSTISGSGYIGFYHDGNRFKVVAVSNNSGFKVQCIGGDNPSINCNIAYTGEKTSGYYRGSAVLAANYTFVDENGGSLYAFNSLNDALIDYFGESPSFGDDVLNGEGYIINENPSYAPLSGFSALNYPYRTKIVDNHTDTTDPDDPVEYPEGVNEVEPNPVYKDVPTWLVDPTVDIPEEPDYLENVDVELPEIEPDTGFITDCYNALPSGIVSMIAVGLGLGVVMKIIS